MVGVSSSPPHHQTEDVGLVEIFNSTHIMWQLILKVIRRQKKMVGLKHCMDLNTELSKQDSLEVRRGRYMFIEGVPQFNI